MKTVVAIVFLFLWGQFTMYCAFGMLEMRHDASAANETKFQTRYGLDLSKTECDYDAFLSGIRCSAEMNQKPVKYRCDYEGCEWVLK